MCVLYDCKMVHDVNFVSKVDPNRGACLDKDTGLLVNHAYRLIDMKVILCDPLLHMQGKKSPMAEVAEGEEMGDVSSLLSSVIDTIASDNHVSSHLHGLRIWRVTGEIEL